MLLEKNSSVVNKRTIATNSVLTLLFIAGLGLTIVTYGAIPFFSLPTLGQALGTTIGWAHAFINNEGLSIYSYNFGYPEPAARSFGLVGVLTTSIFMRLGISGADAYSLMVCFWLSASFTAAYKIGNFYGTSSLSAILGATLWSTMGIIWAHDGYSMLSIGIALLPLYMFSAIKLWQNNYTSISGKLTIFVLYCSTCLIAIFMDGYSFVMFAAASSIIALYEIFQPHSDRGYVIKFALPIHVFALLLSYTLFSFYIGRASFEGSSLGFYRGWGLDISFVAMPTKGIYWLWDILGMTVARSSKDYFGDASVWQTTFCLPVILFAFIGWWRIRKKRNLANAFLFMAVVGFYMALGPSLKINSTKPYSMGPIMQAEFAVAPTGSAFLYENIPGIKNMRASYRWTALGIFACWILIVLCLSERGRYSPIVQLLVFFLIMSNIPNLPKRINSKISTYNMSMSLDKEIVKDMRSDIAEYELVAFLPYDNDLFANYLAGKLNFRSYNIGGDKNLKIAKSSWPKIMKEFTMRKIDDEFTNRLILLLILDQADKVVLPYVDMLWAVHKWPTSAKLEDEIRGVVEQLKAVGFLSVVERDHYTTVSIRESYNDQRSREKLFFEFVDGTCIAPFCISNTDFSVSRPSTIVGEIQESVLITSETKGFLLYGPYKPLLAGKYTLKLIGSSSRVSANSWVDLIGDHSTPRQTRFFKQNLNKFSTKKGILAKSVVNIEQDVRRLEFRVFVDKEDIIELSGFTLRPVIDDQRARWMKEYWGGRPSARQ